MATPVAARLCSPQGGSSTRARKGSKARLDARGRSVFAFGAGGRGRPFWSGFWRLAIRLSAVPVGAGGFVSSRRPPRRSSCCPMAAGVGVMTVMVVMVVVAYLQELPAAGRRRARSEFQVSLMRAAGAAGSSPRAVVFRPARPPAAARSAAAGGLVRNAGGAVWLLAFTFVHSCSTFVNIRNS